jgi:protein gp37
MSDPFYGALPIEDQALVWAVMAADPAHIFQCLTKRQGILRSELARLTPALLSDGLDRLEVIVGKGRRLTPTRRRILGDIEAAREVTLPLPNVMLGVSAEDRHWWKIRVDVLRSIPAAARFVSVEPMIGDLGPIGLTGIDWVICGGESGRNRRRLDLDWARDLRDQCESSGVAFWFKQIGGITPKAGGRHARWPAVEAALRGIRTCCVSSRGSPALSGASCPARERRIRLTDALSGCVRARGRDPHQRGGRATRVARPRCPGGRLPDGARNGWSRPPARDR